MRPAARDQLRSETELVEAATPEAATARVLAAAALIRSGRIIELARPLHHGEHGEPNRIHRLTTNAVGLLPADVVPGGRGAASWMDELVVTNYHLGTHVDALAHVGRSGRFHGD